MFNDGGAEECGWEMAQACEEERVKLLREAFEECRQKGVSKKSLLTLAFETGATWESNHTPARREPVQLKPTGT